MKIVVLVPSAESLATAGVRIRYDRLREPLTTAGISLAITPIDAFDALKAQCDAAIVSKCYDARALVAAAVLVRRRIAVGIDLFDDYFSDDDDTRLARYRTWLRQMMRLVQFTICSTPSMERVVLRYRPDVPVHILNDPAPAVNAAALSPLLDRKISRAKTSAALRVSWFGIGDNPFFPVGLSDLTAFADAFRQLASDRPVELSVLTNKRALDAKGLSMIAQLPVRPHIEIWSSQREAALLRRTDVCVLPVSAQPFSISKSMNRALTALCSGNQVLSLGYPLYASLDELIYRDVGALLRDWRAGEPLLRPSSVTRLSAKIADLASPTREAARLSDFLKPQVSTAPTVTPGPIALLHGFATSQAAHLAVKTAGGLSIATPFSSQDLGFDGIVKSAAGGNLSLFLAEDAALKPAFRHRRNRGKKCVGAAGEAETADPRDLTKDSLPVQIALYEQLIEAASAMISQRLGATVLLSEESAFPVEPAI